MAESSAGGLSRSIQDLFGDWNPADDPGSASRIPDSLRAPDTPAESGSPPGGATSSPPRSAPRPGDGHESGLVDAFNIDPEDEGESLDFGSLAARERSAHDMPPPRQPDAAA